MTLSVMKTSQTIKQKKKSKQKYSFKLNNIEHYLEVKVETPHK